MDIETHINVDGAYIPVTRRITIQDIINSGRKETTESPPVPKPPPMPQIGLLHKTIIGSPVVKWIFTARIRHADFNDLVFVGEDFVHIKEIMPDGRLQHIGTKSGFRSRIRATNIIGKKVEVDQPSLKDGIPPIKRERVSPLSSASYDHLIPPNMLVLAFEDSELMFLFADQQQKNGILYFHESLIPFPRQRNMTQQPGSQITVDPSGTVMAVAAYNLTLSLFRIKNWQLLNSEFRADKHDWCPIIHEKQLKVDGPILKLTFLNPGDGAENSWILVMIVRVGEKSRLYSYVGALSSELADIKPGIKEQSLSPAYEYPDLMIPYNHSPRFLLISGNQIFYFKDALQAETPTRMVIKFSDGVDCAPKHWGSSSRLPIFTAWVHATRSSKFREEVREEIYLLREDGVLFGHTLHASFGVNGFRKVMEFDFHGSTALASLLFTHSLMDPDTLVAGGDMSNGEMISLGYRGNFPKSDDTGRYDFMRQEKLQSFANWSPILDVEIMQPKDSLHQPRSRPSIFVTSGRQPYSFVTELRYGHEASVKLEWSIGEDLNAATGIWTVADPSLEGSVYFISFPDHTIVVRVMNDFQEALFEPEETGASLTEQTLAVMQGDDKVIQVTRNGILILEFEETTGTLHRRASLDLTEAKLIAAAIDSKASSIILALHSDSGLVLQQYSVDTSTKNGVVKAGGEPPALDDYPTAITIFEHGLQTYVAVGLQSSVIHLWAVFDKSGFRKLASYDLVEQQSDSQANVIEDIGVLTDCSGTELVLLCGLRGGSLFSLNLEVLEVESYPTLIFGERRTWTLGATPVRIFTDLTSTTPTGFAVCGPDICRVDYGHGRELGILLSSVWFQDGLKPNFAQPFLPVMHILSTLTEQTSTTCGIVLYAASTLIIASVESMKKTVPRKIPLSVAAMGGEIEKVMGPPVEPQVHKDSPGTPHALLYSKSLNAMVIALTKYSVRPGTRQENPWSGTRIWNGAVQFLPIATRPQDDIDDGEEEGVESSMGTIVDFHPGERVLSMCEWTFSDGGSMNEKILVGTALTENGSKSGRLYFLKPRLDADGRIHVRLSQIKSVEHAVRAMAVYDEKRVVVCDGSRLSVYGLDRIEQNLKWVLYAKTDLPDAARHVSTRPPYIYVTTVSKSFHAYHVSRKPGLTGNGTEHPLEIRPFFGDGMARNAITHLVISVPSTIPDAFGSTAPTSSSGAAAEQSLVLITDRSATLSVLPHPITPAQHSGVRPLLQTSLPQCITRLAHAPVRPPWLSSSRSPGILSSNIIGTTVDGTVYSLAILDAPTRVLLKFLENLVLWDRAGVLGHGKRNDGEATVVIDPEAKAWRARTASSTTSFVFGRGGGGPRSPSSGSAGASYDLSGTAGNYCINADHLQPFLLPGGATCLLDLLMQSGRETEDGVRAGNDVETRCERFVELCEGLLPPILEGSTVSSHERLERAVRRCVIWLGDIAGDYL